MGKLGWHILGLIIVLFVLYIFVSFVQQAAFGAGVLVGEEMVMRAMQEARTS